MHAAACNDFQDVSAFLNTFYCSGCGVCENFSCPQGLSPRKLVLQVKGGLRAAGVKPPKDVKVNPVNPAREYRKVPLERLVARLGVKKYQVDAPLNNELVESFDEVKENLSQHIGAPAKAVVKIGDRVERGQLVAQAADGLSVNIHASLTGIVTRADEKSITIVKA